MSKGKIYLFKIRYHKQISFKIPFIRLKNVVEPNVTIFNKFIQAQSHDTKVFHYRDELAKSVNLR